MYFGKKGAQKETELFEKLYEKNKQMLYMVAYKVLHNKFDAEDAVQNAFIKIAEKFERYRFKPYNSLVQICKTVVRHEAINIIRKRKIWNDFKEGLDRTEIEDISRDILSDLIMRYESDMVTGAVMQLEEKDRELLAMQYVHGLKPKAIGKWFRISPKKISKEMMRLRNKVSRILEENGFDRTR